MKSVSLQVFASGKHTKKIDGHSACDFHGEIHNFDAVSSIAVGSPEGKPASLIHLSQLAVKYG